MGYFDLKKQIQSSPKTSSKSGYFALKQKALPIIESNMLRRQEEEKRKRYEEAVRNAEIAKQQAEKANTFRAKAGEFIFGGGLKDAVLHPIKTTKKAADFMTRSASETAYDLFYQKDLDKQNLKQIQDNSQKVIDINEKIKASQNEAEKEKLKRQAKIYLDFNQKLSEETGGELKDKTNWQLAGQALGTALDLTPFLGFGSLGTKVGLKTLGTLGVKSATKQLAAKTGGKVFGKVLPQTGKELTKQAMVEGGLYGGLSGFGGGLEDKDATIKSVATSTALGTALGVGLGGTLSKIFGRLGSKSEKLKKIIDEGTTTEKEIIDIFENKGIKGVEEIVSDKRVLEAGEVPKVVKEIETKSGRKLNVKEILQVNDDLKKGISKETIIDELAPEAPKMPVEPIKPKVEVKTPVKEKVDTEPLIQSLEEFMNSKPFVYHGSPVPLKSFSNKKGGVFFTEEYADATGFAGSPDNVYEGYLNFKKPLEIDAKGAKWDDLNTKYGKSTQEVISNAQKDGYDGVVFKNVIDNIADDAEAGMPGTIYYAYKPKDAFLNESQLKELWKEQVKSQPLQEGVKIETPKLPEKGKSITAQKMNKRFADDKQMSTEYDVIEINKKLDEATKKLRENPEKAISEAFSEEGSNVDKIATLTELFEKSIKDGDEFMQKQAFNKLKQLAPETAQSLNMFKALTEANPHFSYMSSVVDAKLKNLVLSSSNLRKATKGMKPSEALNKAKKMAKEKITKDILNTKSKITIKKAQDLLDSLICK